jgi:dihydrodipicolinate synthase/N-acetylneuraminate lyase
MLHKKSEAKEWARGAYVGLDTTILPCFTPDTLELDEAGIRHDMRMLVPQGFFAVTLVSGGEACTTCEEDQRFVEWCVDEARGKLGVTLTTSATGPWKRTSRWPVTPKRSAATA